MESGRSRGPCRTSAADPKRTLALPQEVEHWSLTRQRDRLVKIGSKVIRHGRYITFQIMEMPIPRALFAAVPAPY